MTFKEFFQVQKVHKSSSNNNGHNISEKFKRRLQFHQLESDSSSKDHSILSSAWCPMSSILSTRRRLQCTLTVFIILVHDVQSVTVLSRL